MSNWRKLAGIGFLLFTLACLCWLALGWLSINLLSFPCDSPEDPRPCSTVVPWLFVTRLLLPTLAIWSAAAWLVFRKRSAKRRPEESVE